MVVEVLSTLAHARCRNCDEPIVQLQGDLSGLKWLHSRRLREPCQDAPVAEPRDGTTVQHTTPEPTAHTTPDECRMSERTSDGD
jgi:hypothetical protein